MEVIPAIDLRGGKCVRLTKGDYSREKSYSGDPAATAREFKRAGATRLHIVDLDGARDGRPANLEVAVSIRRDEQIGLPVEFGGGVRSLEDIRRVLSFGIDDVMVGTAGFADPELFPAAAREFGDRILAAVDVRAGRVVAAGWLKDTGLAADAAIELVAEAGVKRILYTDTDRDGTLEGADAGRLAAVIARCRALGLGVHFAGGVRDLADIKRLKELDQTVLRAVIAGRAIYEGTLDLAEAIAF